MTGTMKNSIAGKDFRFIASDNPAPGEKPDVFAYKDSFVGVTMDELKEGDKVSFDVEPSPKGPRAVNIKRM